ncbi:MAG: hypothetical protein IIA59_04220 [Candidatus Marinimicrobia bacterium]|nr:hypothetical protein [Candidatus Neomarinimicrobiota bacterium]
MTLTNIKSTRILIAVAWMLILAPKPVIGQSTKDLISRDFEYFGRKSTFTLGSAFNTLAIFSPFDNPAGLAFTTDNHISFDLATTVTGSGHHITLAAPNFAISSGNQTHDTADDEYREKSFFRLAYGLGFGSGGPSEGLSFAVGAALNRKVDSVFVFDSSADTTQSGQGIRVQALMLEAGAIVNLGAHRISVYMHDIFLSGDSADVYVPRFVIGYSTVTNFGTRVAVNILPGAGYVGKNIIENGDTTAAITTFGFQLGVGQSFFDSRLDTRIQLSSFFSDSGKATMQNITGGIGYRLAPRRSSRLAAIILDTEFSYTLSFLALPNSIGGHLFGLVKHF